MGADKRKKPGGGGSVKASPGGGGSRITLKERLAPLLTRRMVRKAPRAARGARGGRGGGVHPLRLLLLAAMHATAHRHAPPPRAIGAPS